MDCFVALGSNLGSRRRHLELGIWELEVEGLSPHAISSVWETEPIGVRGDWFLNMVVALRSELTPRELLDRLLRIEHRAGRQRFHRVVPRTLDMDLLMMGDLRVDEPDLQLPHPRMFQRRFVLEPLAEIAPDLCNPSNGRTVAQELDRLPNRHYARRVASLATGSRNLL